MRQSPTAGGARAQMQLGAAPLGAGYLVSCALLLVTNKLCVQRVPAPAAVHIVQFAFSAALPAMLHCVGVMRVDGFKWASVKATAGMAVLSSTAMYFNMASLRNTDVSTILVVRACCPLANCLLEHAFLGRDLPSRQSFFMLCVVAMSAMAYAATMEHHPQPGYAALLLCYFVFICGSDTLGKWIVSGLQWQNKQWGPVLHLNTLSHSVPATHCCLYWGGARLAARGVVGHFNRGNPPSFLCVGPRAVLLWLAMPRCDECDGLCTARRRQ